MATKTLDRCLTVQERNALILTSRARKVDGIVPEGELKTVARTLHRYMTVDELRELLASATAKIERFATAKREGVAGQESELSPSQRWPAQMRTR